MSEKITVKDSGIHGKGVFASIDMKKGETICYMKGEEMNIKEMKRRYDADEEPEEYPLQVSEEIYVDLEHPYDYLNHSCNPNSALIEKNKLIAIKEIRKGEEIKFDYSLTEWTDDSQWGEEYEDSWTMKCNCGEESCRKIVREFDKLPRRFQKKAIAAGHVQDFILRKYSKIYNTQN